MTWCFTFVRIFIKISGTVFNLKSGHEYTIETAMFNVQRAITPKVGKAELQLICSACNLIVLYICVKFHENTSNRFQLTERRTQVHGRNGYVQCSKAITPKVGKPDLRFMCSAHCLILLYICVKFTLNGIRVMEQTGMMEALTDGWTLKIFDGIT